MANIKEYKRKLKSLVNTRKITKTMKMVAASKLRKAYEAQAHAKLYANSLAGLMSRISASVDTQLHPILTARDNNTKALVVVFTSDTGLCGAFNHNVTNQVVAWVSAAKNRYTKIDLSFCGRRGFVFFQKRANIKNYYKGVTAHPKFSDAKTIGSDLMESLISGEYDEVYLAYNQFYSPLSQRTIFEQVLPIDPNTITAEHKVTKPTDYLFEPQVAQLLEFLVPHFLYFKIYFALLENSAGEHGARMSAMDNATKNATEFINRYTLLRNRARQAQITIELAEIIGGAE